MLDVLIIDRDPNSSLRMILFGKYSNGYRFNIWSKKIWEDQKDILYSPSICHYWNHPGLSPLTCSPLKTFTKSKPFFSSSIDQVLNFWLAHLVRSIQGSLALTSPLPALLDPRPLVSLIPLSSSPRLSSHPSSKDHCLRRQSKWSSLPTQYCQTIVPQVTTKSICDVCTPAGQGNRQTDLVIAKSSVHLNHSKLLLFLPPVDPAVDSVTLKSLLRRGTSGIAGPWSDWVGGRLALGNRHNTPGGRCTKPPPVVLHQAASRKGQACTDHQLGHQAPAIW